MVECEYEDDERFEDVPVSPVLKVVRQSESAVEEDEDDVIGWSEVQRLMYEQMWGPILDLPVAKDDSFLQRQWEDGVDASAFNTHDFRRIHPEFGRKVYAVRQAEREHQHAVMMFEMVFDRVKQPGKYVVMRYLKRGVIQPEMCTGQMQRAAIWDRRVQKALKKLMGIRRWSPA